jgi:putative transposase
MFDFCRLWLYAYFRQQLPGGKKSLVAENIFLRQQLAILRRKQGFKKCPRLNNQDKIIFAVLGGLLSKVQLVRSAIVIRPSTVLKLHRLFVNAKYRFIYKPSVGKPGPQKPSRALIDLVVQTKIKNPSMGCLQIAQLISLNFDFTIGKSSVFRILKQYLPSAGPSPNESWLALFGVKRDHLWSMDLFRVESAFLKAHWVMVVMDMYSRRIVGFASEKGSVDAATACRMFNRIALGQTIPKYLSTDWDELFQTQIWEAGLRVREIQHVRSIGGVPWSHPYIESVIGKIRSECTDRILFFSQEQLEARLEEYRVFFNDRRPHSSLSGHTPETFCGNLERKKASIGKFRWKGQCRGLFSVPTAC